MYTKKKNHPIECNLDRLLRITYKVLEKFHWGSSKCFNKIFGVTRRRLPQFRHSTKHIVLKHILSSLDPQPIYI